MYSFTKYFLTIGSSLVLASALFGAKEEPIDSRFRPAPPDPLVGDWQGTGPYVAQLALDEHGDYQVNLLRTFDAASNVVATLRGKARSNSVVLRGGGWNATVEKDQLVATKDAEHLDLRHIVRAIATLGAKPPKGALVLFDGKNLDAFANKKGKDWLVEDGPAPWKIVEGNILEVVPGTGGGIITRQKFGDCHVHVEFRTLGAPSNSGVFLQARYEVNINETYGQLNGTPNGGLDNCTDQKPLIHASRAPLEWQVFDIDFRAPCFDADGKKTANARASVSLNGVNLYEQQELGPVKGAAGRLGEAPRGPLLFQEHGMPVQFRNLWVVPTETGTFQ